MTLNKLGANYFVVSLAWLSSCRFLFLFSLWPPYLSSLFKYFAKICVHMKSIIVHIKICVHYCSFEKELKKLTAAISNCGIETKWPFMGIHSVITVNLLLYFMRSNWFIHNLFMWGIFFTYFIKVFYRVSQKNVASN